MIRAGLAALVLVVSTSAWAQPTLPTRDVTVVYRVEGGAHAAIPGGIPDTVRLAWSAREQRLRVEPEGRTQVLLVDLAAGRVRLLDRGLHGAMALPVRPEDLDPVRLRDVRLVRRGPMTVAGLPCTDYAAQSRHGRGTLCLTDDGVVLRAAGEVNGRQGGATALSVAYAPLPPNLFEVPPGFMNLSLPPGLGQLP